MRWALLILALLSMLPLSFAALLEEDTLYLILGFVIFVVVVMLAIVYMMSKSLNLPQLEAWAKTEVRELFVAAALVVIVGMVLASSNLVAVLSGAEHPEDEARDFLNGMKDQTETGYIRLMRLMHYLTVRTGFSSLVPLPTPYVYSTYMVGPSGGFSVLMGPITMASQGLINAWMTYTGILMFYEFVLKAASIILPIGFMFRFIPFTRKIGNTVLALAIGGKILLPLGILLVGYFHGLITVPDLTIPESAIDDLDISGLISPFLSICSITAIRVLLNMNETIFGLVTCLPVAWIPGAFPVCFNLMTQIVYPIMMLIFKIGYAAYFTSIGIINSLSGTAMGLTGGEGADIVYDFLIQVNNYALVAYIDAIFIALISYGGTKAISGALGGEYMMPAVSRLVR